MNTRRLIYLTLGRLIVVNAANRAAAASEGRERQAPLLKRTSESPGDKGRPSTPLMTGVPQIPRLW